MVSVSLPYGEEEITLSLPRENQVEVLKPNAVTLPPSEEEELTRALDHPLGTKRLEEIVRGKGRVVLLCEDLTRPTPLDRILPHLLERLHAAGVPASEVLIIMALGSHRPMTEAEMRRKVGEEVYARARIDNSEFRAPARLVDLGCAPGGVRVWVDKRVAEADVRIGIGSIAPHPAVGYTGGGKIIYPGVTGEETVAQFHLRSAFAGNLLGQTENPVRKEMESWVEVIGLDFIANCVLTPQGRIYRVVAGHYVAAHRQGVRFAHEIYGVPARERAEIALVSSHPADFDLWQGTKGVLSGELILKDGGTLILLAPCFEGVGPHPSFPDYIGGEGLEPLLQEARAGRLEPREALPLSVGFLLNRVGRRIKIFLVSTGITAQEAARAGFTYFPDPEAALEEALRRHGPGARIAVIPYGGHTYPYLAGER